MLSQAFLGAVLALVQVVLFGAIVQFSQFSLGSCKTRCVILTHSGHFIVQVLP
jgi:hypothetical protein